MSETGRRDWIAWLALIILAWLLGQAQNNARRAGDTDRISSTARSIAQPISGTATSVADGMGGFFASLGRGPALIKEIDKLRAEKAALEGSDDRIAELEADIQRLEGALELADSLEDALPVRIIGHFTDEARITLNAGSKDGVKPGQAVTVEEGLLAVVQSVDEESSQALLITSPLVGLGARIMDEEPVEGVVRGSDPDTLIMDYTENLEVSSDARVVTSGFSEHIPAGLEIGRILSRRKVDEYGFRQVRILPSARLGRHRVAVIVR